mmetsp:Transcript_29565/g.53718  ORF Transcript_29565/g.53718 Transcript_29565/m.53718 type:complete len:1185 (+) Transcript_29565:95-3649(+)
MVAAAPIAEAAGAALCWATGLCLISRPRELGSDEPVASQRTWSSASFRAGSLVYLAGHALSVASALELGSEDLSVSPWRGLALSFALPCCWIIQVVIDQRVQGSQAAASWACFLGTALMQPGLPTPVEGPDAGLKGLRRMSGFSDYPVAGFAAYGLSCLLCLLVGVAAVASTFASGTAETEGKQASTFARTTSMRLGLLVAVLCGAAAVASELALAIGAEACFDPEESQYGTFSLILGAVLALSVVRSSWECLHRLSLPLGDFAPLIFGSSAVFRAIQAPLLFRELSWPEVEAFQEGVSTPIQVFLIAGGSILLIGIITTCCKVLLFLPPESAGEEYKALARADAEQVKEEDTAAASMEEAALAAKAQARRAKEEAEQRQEPSRMADLCHSIVSSNVFKQGWQWLGVIICAISYYAGITRALFLITPPEAIATAPAIERSNLQLISYLCSVGMPLASLMVLIFSVIIPLFKFATTFLVMHPPAWVTQEQHAKFCNLLCAMSPYQMSDIFLVMLILAYLNTGFSAGGSGSGYECTLCSGFKSFFVYCFVSIFVAQVLEIQHAEALEEAPEHPGSATTKTLDSGGLDEAQDAPGIYAIVRPAAVVPTVHMSGTKEIHISLKAGDIVEVLEVVRHDTENRLRGRIANPPGWISLLDLEDSYRWAERQEGRPEVEENLARLLFFLVLWLLCMFSLTQLPCPPMSLQARSGGIIIYRQEPTLGHLFFALWEQSPLFSSLMVIVLVMTPVLFVLAALARTLLFRHMIDPIWARRLWVLEQILKPWVMGDVAAVSITSLFLSIQEPSTDFVFLCVRIPGVPSGFLACLGQGVASWGLRWCTPALRPSASSSGATHHEVTPASELQSTDSPPPSSIISAFSAAWRSCQKSSSTTGGVGAAKTSSWLGGLVWREVLALLFWFTIFWQLGPHEPPSVHSLKDMNAVLQQEVPRVNLLLMENVPPSLGDCDALHEHERKQNVSISKDDCKDIPMKPIHVPAIGLEASIEFIDGISSLRILELQVIPESAVNRKESDKSQGFSGGQRWAIKAKGQFTDLKIWARASKGGTDWVNGYICCHNPYHLALQLSVSCLDGVGFRGNVTVDDFHIDPVDLAVGYGDNSQSEGVHSMFQIEMGAGSNGLIHEAIKSHLESVIVAKTGGTTPVQAGLPTFSLTDALNKVLWFNRGVECPKFKP